MELSAQTHFRQGWNTKLIKEIESLGIDTIRDSIAWHKVETKKGKYDFSLGTANWVDKALDSGLDVLLVFDPHNGLYDKGHTIYSKKALAAFADFVVATLKEFPGVTAIEIGNEYNGNGFVSGPIAKAPKSKRDDYYKSMVEAVDKALTKAGIDVDVLGASTHSVPVDYLDKLEKNGTLDMVDGVSVHPYSTEPEQFADQLAVLRARIGDDIEVHVTEFADKFDSPEDASAYLAKMVAIMAESGVSSANWYAFAKQSAYPNMELWDQHADRPTLAGITFSILEDMLADGAQVSQIGVDGQTYFYTFGANTAILWGEGRSVTLAEGVQAFDLAGALITDFASISPDMPVILRSEGTIDASSVEFGDNYLIADSFHDFDIANGAGTFEGSEGQWTYFVENGKGREYDVDTQGGDIGGGQPWTPYLGLDWLLPLQIGSKSVTPADFSKKNKPQKDYATVERFTAEEDGVVTIRGSWDVADHSTNGVQLTIRVNDKKVFQKDIKDKSNGYEFDLELSGIRLEAGDTIDFVISSRNDSKGDVTTRRIQIYEDDVPFDADYVPVSHVPVLPDDWGDGGSSGGGSGGTGGSGGNDGLVINGNRKNNTLKGKDGDDRISGEKGNDKLFGGLGDDFLKGGKGADKLFGGEGNDVLVGNRGKDIFGFEDSFGHDTIKDFSNGDRIDLSGVSEVDRFKDLEITKANKHTIITIGDDTITLENVKPNELDAGDFLF